MKMKQFSDIHTTFTEGKTGSPRCSPSTPGLTPPTIFVPHSSDSFTLAVAWRPGSLSAFVWKKTLSIWRIGLPVNPWNSTRVCAPIFKFGSVSAYFAERGEVENGLTQRSCGTRLKCSAIDDRYNKWWFRRTRYWHKMRARQLCIVLYLQEYRHASKSEELENHFKTAISPSRLSDFGVLHTPQLDPRHASFSLFLTRLNLISVMNWWAIWDFQSLSGNNPSPRGYNKVIVVR